VNRTPYNERLRYKTLIGNRLNFRCHDAQVAEMLVGVKALNKMLSLGMPVRREIEKTNY
jgi:hypothetical protein